VCVHDASSNDHIITTNGRLVDGWNNDSLGQAMSQFVDVIFQPLESYDINSIIESNNQSSLIVILMLYDHENIQVNMSMSITHIYIHHATTVQ
jgi:hypothetical protein